MRQPPASPVDQTAVTGAMTSRKARRLVKKLMASGAIDGMTVDEIANKVAELMSSRAGASVPPTDAHHQRDDDGRGRGHHRPDHPGRHGPGRPAHSRERPSSAAGIIPAALTINEFCEYVRCGRTKAYDLASKGLITILKSGSKSIVLRTTADAYLNSLPIFGQRRRPASTVPTNPAPAPTSAAPAATPPLTP